MSNQEQILNRNHQQNQKTSEMGENERTITDKLNDKIEGLNQNEPSPLRHQPHHQDENPHQNHIEELKENNKIQNIQEYHPQELVEDRHPSNEISINDQSNNIITHHQILQEQADKVDKIGNQSLQGKLNEQKIFELREMKSELIEVMQSSKTIESKFLSQKALNNVLNERLPSFCINQLKISTQQAHPKNQSTDHVLNAQTMLEVNKHSLQPTENQKYRLNSQFVESVQEDKQQKIVDFVQFPQPQNYQTIPQSVKQQQVQQAQQHPDNQLNFSFSQSKQNKVHQKSKQQIITIKSSQKPSKQDSPSKTGIGKFSKKVLHEKKIHEAMVDLQRHDTKIVIIPRFEQNKKTTKKADLSKLQTRITLNSNIMSLTIGQLMCSEHNEAAILLNQIQQLKQKLSSIQLSMKQQQQPKRQTVTPAEEDHEQVYQRVWPQKVEKEKSIQQEPVLTNKHNKRQNIGQFYRKIQFNHSKLSEQLQLAGLSARKQAIFNKSDTITSAPKPRFSSAEVFQGSNSDHKDKSLENKAGIIAFRVRKNNKNPLFDEHQNKNAKDIGFIKSIEKSVQKDQCFQTKKQNLPKLEFTEEEKMNIIEKPAQRELKMQEKFNEYIERFFFDIGNQLPKRDWSQQELVEIAKITFKKFGANLEVEKQTLHIKKYKNCVSFILDSTRTILWYYEGKFYYGGWNINNTGEGEKNGWGYEISPKKFVYSGNFKQNKKDGYGIIKYLTRQNDVVYQGHWKNGLKHGYGKQKQADDSIYIGEWTQGKKNGQGILKINEKQIYEGAFASGVKNGEGKETFVSGDTYQGTYLEGKFHGFGIYTWANFSRYEGEFKNGSRNGQGKWVSDYRDKKSDSYEGQYKDDKKSGFGMYRWKDDTAYEGQFLNDLKHGEGVVSYADGKSAKFQWFEGNIVSQQIDVEQKINPKPIMNGKERSQSEQSKKSTPKPPIVKFNVKSSSKPKPVRTTLGVQQI